jgi:hypothetical protein
MTPPVPLRVLQIMRDACDRHGVTLGELLSPSRTVTACRCRRYAMSRVRGEVEIDGRPASYPLIGRWFNRDHSAVMSLLGATKRTRPPSPPARHIVPVGLVSELRGKGYSFRRIADSIRGTTGESFTTSGLSMAFYAARKERQSAGPV